MQREFLYLDERLVDQFLAQVEDGLFDDEKEKESSTGRRDIEGTVGAGPVRARAKADRGSERETERLWRQTPESRFNRLHPHLDLKYLDENGQDAYGKLDPRGMVEVECYVDVPTISRTLAGAEEIAGVAELIRQFTPGEVDPEIDKAIAGVSTVAQKTSGAVVATGEIGEGQAILAFKLSPQSLRVSLDELEGDAVVVGKVQRKWSEGQRYPLLNVPGLNLLNREDRRKLEREKKAPSSGSGDEAAFIEGPGASLTIIAIYR